MDLFEVEDGAASTSENPLKKGSHVLTVTEITRRIKGVLEMGFSEVWVEGEISNFKQHSSGHWYFTLKDEGAQLSAVMWRSRAAQVLFRPTDGMKVLLRGNITVYEPRGNYQIDCLQIQPLGAGELQLAFERLKKKLQAEGLFDGEHKKPLPLYPERIGIVTSPTGAAIRDMLNILTRRFPGLDIILVPVKVQGIGAAEEIAEAIHSLNDYGNVDVMIVGRGGGSLEDLWAFNEEIVARAIYDSAIPVISAVGHEIDFSIADFVADLRAPTPSAAAELVVRDRAEVLETLRNFCYTMQQHVSAIINSKKERVHYLRESHSFNKPVDLLRQRSQRVDEMEHWLLQTISHVVSLSHHRSESLMKRVHSLNPQAVLKRGYAIVRKAEHSADSDKGKVIPSVKRLSAHDDVQIEFHDGVAQSVITNVVKGG
ncbi:MAG: exodeoxyribonuclease VII large subunit [Bacteroidota bacterium]|nr:exodeoxyribonuclease VII large subunit [Bacteroidota bacterium]